MRTIGTLLCVVLSLSIVAACGGAGIEPSGASVTIQASPSSKTTLAPTASASAPASAAPSLIPVTPIAFAIPTPVPLEPVETVLAKASWGFYPAEDWVIKDEGRTVERLGRKATKTANRIKPVATVHVTVIAFGSLWSTDFDRDVVHRYDLATGAHVAAIDVGRGPDGMIVADGSIWVADHAGGAVERIDPATNEIVATVVTGKPGRGGPAGLAVDDGLLWVAVPIPGQAIAIDMATNAVVATVDVPMLPCGVAAWSGRIWLDQCSDTGPTIAWFDPDMRQPTVVSLPELTFLAGEVAGRTWVIRHGVLIAIDPATFHPMEARSLPSPIQGMIVDGDDVWFSLEDRWVRVPVSALAAQGTLRPALEWRNW